jgi:hypothetical protein
MDPGAVGAVSGLGLLVLLGCVVCLYDTCVDRRELLPLYHRAPRPTRLFPGG